MKPRLIVLAATACLVAVFFAPALSGAQSFVFRDAAHFYHPLFECIRGQWLEGRLPLWNPHDNLGVPLVAENTSSVFYPGWLLFALPLDFTQLYNVYIVAHVALAAGTAYWLARQFRASVFGAGLAGMSYAFSGTVLFQYANVVFLVGAAWLPCALGLAEQALAGRRVGSAIGLGVVLALMVTGGDPQMAYNAGLLAVLYAVLLWRLRRAQRSLAVSPPRGRGLTRLPVLLAIAAGAGMLLSAVQILPTLEASRSSSRAAYDAPRSVFELATYLAARDDAPDDAAGERSTWYSGLLDAEPAGHQRHVFQFSVGPWRVFEFLWPNASGRYFPTNRRWLNVMPAEGRVWVPSLYMGLLPFLLAAATWSLRRGAPLEVRWWSWMVLICGLGAMGIYGGGWAVRELQTLCGFHPVLPVGDEVGGLYWLLTVLLPGYVYFRYPAKLLVLTALGLSLLAARGWDQAWESPRIGLRRALVALATISLAGLALLSIVWPWVVTRLERMPPDPLFGPFDSAGAYFDMAHALFQASVMSLLLWMIFWRSAAGQGRPAGPIFALLLTAADLAIAGHWMVAYAPADDWRVRPTALELLPADAGNTRVFRAGDRLPDAWRNSSSLNRQTEGLLWDRDTLLPRYHLPYGISLLEASSSIASFDYQVALDVAREHGPVRAGAAEPHGTVLDLLAARFSILLGDGLPEDGRLLGSPAEGATVCRRGHALPRARIVHQVEVLPALPSRTPQAIKARTAEVLFPAGQPRDWSRLAVVETDEPVEIPTSSADAPAGESCVIRTDEPERVDIDVRLAAPGLVVLADLYYPGWKCFAETDGQLRPLTILRANRVMRAVLLPAGDHRLTFRYRPASVLWGGAISALTAGGLAVAGFVAVLRRRRSAELSQI